MTIDPLVDAEASGSPAFTHDNPYNRFIAQDGAEYFSIEDDVARHLDELVASPIAVEVP